jgi:hypothetical protein
MKLHQDELYKYFGLADQNNSWLQTPTNLFDFVNRDSDILVVTIGDSWTYGCELDPKSRNQEVYGAQLAQRMAADWLNLAIPAQGNFWIAHMVKQLSAIIPKLTYRSIYCVCTFTDPTRWFNTHFDQDVDYIQWFRDNVYTENDFDLFLSMRNQLCVKEILQHLEPFDHVHLRVGTNFVEHTGLEQLQPKQLLPLPWYRVLGLNDNTDVKVIFYYSRIETVIKFISQDKHNMFKNWFLKTTALGDLRLNLLLGADNFKNVHPPADAHEAWAKYIYDSISI